MEKKDFFEAVRKEIKDWVGKETEVILHEIMKINGTVRTGLIVCKEGNSNGVSPIIYLDRYYDEFQNGETSFEEILNGIKENLVASENTEPSTEFISSIADWQLAKDHIYPALISAKRNQKLLESIVHEDFLDLKIIYLLRTDIDEFGKASGTVKVTKELMESYGVSQSELHNQAMRNMKKDGITIQDITEVLFGQNKDDSTKMVPNNLYVLTSREQYYGACALLDTDFLYTASGGNDCYVLPSSIHETLVMLKDENMDTNTLNEMVRTVNETEVQDSEILSDHIYYFNATNKIIESVA